jgi:hypothetical protein
MNRIYSCSPEYCDQQSVFEKRVRLSLRSKFGEFVPNNRHTLVVKPEVKYLGVLVRVQLRARKIISRNVASIIIKNQLVQKINLWNLERSRCSGGTIVCHFEKPMLKNKKELKDTYKFRNSEIFIQNLMSLISEKFGYQTTVKLSF